MKTKKIIKSVIRAILRYLVFWRMYFKGIEICRRKNRVDTIGKENLPHAAGTLFLANHESYFDSVIIGLSTISIWELLFRQKMIAYNAPDRKNFFGTKWEKFFFGLLKNIPVDRNTKSLEKIEDQIEKFSSTIKNGNNLLLFFEGTRSLDGSIGECKVGVAETILRSQPKHIIPITIIGIDKIIPWTKNRKDSKISRGHKGQVIIGKPLDFSEIINSEIDRKEKVKLICQRVREAVAKNYQQ
jgi:1-acyl-sn-glycerol-3-phosphate acyltransferase